MISRSRYETPRQVSVAAIWILMGHAWANALIFSSTITLYTA